MGLEREREREGGLATTHRGGKFYRESCVASFFFFFLGRDGWRWWRLFDFRSSLIGNGSDICLVLFISWYREYFFSLESVDEYFETGEVEENNCSRWETRII